MGAFETNLVAIKWLKGGYEVLSTIQAEVDVHALKLDGLLHDVSQAGSGYIDEAAVIERNSFRKYLLAGTRPSAEKASLWYSSLPYEARFIIVHRAEWESFVGD